MAPEPEVADVASALPLAYVAMQDEAGMAGAQSLEALERV